MPVSFLSPAQRDSYGQYLGDPSTQELARYFHLDDSDHTQIVEKRGDANRLGFALQLTTVCFVGTFLDDPTAVPPAVLATMSRQLGIDTTTDLTGYRDGKWRLGRYGVCVSDEAEVSTSPAVARRAAPAARSTSASEPSRKPVAAAARDSCQRRIAARVRAPNRPSAAPGSKPSARRPCWINRRAALSRSSAASTASGGSAGPHPQDNSADSTTGRDDKPSPWPPR